MLQLQTNFYDKEIYFAITFNNEVNLIIEPMGWDKITNHIPRDPNYFGFWSDFLEDKYGMLFTFIVDNNGLTGGAQILKTIYETVGLGPNTEVLFSVGYKINERLQQVNQWRINLDDYSCDFGGVSTSIEKMPFQGKLRSRINTPCTINSKYTMDGELLTPIPTLSVRLHSKSLLENTRAVSPAPLLSDEMPASFFDSYLIVQPDQSDLITNELKNVFNQPFSIFNSTSNNPASAGTPAPANGSALDKLPFTDFISQYVPETSGTLSIVWSGGGTFYYGWNAFTSGYYWNITPRVVVQRLVDGVQTIISEQDGTTKRISTFGDSGLNPTAPMVGTQPFSINGASQQNILPSVTGSTNRSQVNQVRGYTFNETFNNIEVQKGDNVYVHLLMCPNNTTTATTDKWIQIDGFTNDIKYTQLTVTPSTQSNGYRIADVFNQVLENITGEKNSIDDSFFNGFGYKYALMNGYAIRNYSANIHLPKISLQQLLDDMQGIYCNAYGIKRNSTTGVEKLNIQYISDFFQDKVIAQFFDTFEWKDTHNSGICYNNIELGYNKYQGLNLIQQDEFNTSGSYLTQNIIYNSKTLSKKVNTIASGYIIEEQRRNQFLLNPGQSLQNDEDIFIVSIIDPCIFPHTLIGQTTGLPFVTVFSNVPTLINGINYYKVSFQITSLGLLKGDTFVTSNGANGGDTFTIYGEVEGYPTIGEDIYYIYEIPTNEIINTTVTVTPSSPNQVFCERNQTFKICTGIDDSSTVYNARLSLGHILDNWRPLLGVGLFFVDENSIDYAISQIIPTLIKMNCILSTQFNSSEQYKGNTGDFVIVENQRRRIKDYLKNGINIFSPIGAECKIRIGWNDMDLIRQALCGELTDDINYGGLILRDDFAKDWFCHVMDIQYNLKDEIATIKVQKVREVLPIIS